MLQKRKTSATLHGSAPQKWKTSATLHGNAFFVSMVQQGLPKGAPLKPSKPFEINCFGRFLELHWSSRRGDQKNGRAQVDAKERPSGGCKVLIFPIYYEDLCLLRPRIFFKKCKNALVLYMFWTPSLVPHTTTKLTGKKNHDPKTSATLHESAPAPKKTSATLHGSVPAKKWSPKKGPKKTLQTV